MSEFTDSIAVETSLGQVLVTACVVTPGSNNIETSLEMVKVLPHVPKGMQVRSCVAFLLKIEGSVKLQKIKLSLSLRNGLQGSTCTGERLEAQEWSDEKSMLIAGTEDGEALNLRFPNLKLGEEMVVCYTPNSMSLKLNDLPELHNPSFHFVIAENDDPEPVGTSAWYAVDQDHKFLLAQ